MQRAAISDLAEYREWKANLKTEWQSSNTSQDFNDWLSRKHNIAEFRPRKETMQNIVIDPEFQSLIPSLTQDEYDQLEKNIVADGCRDPLVLWRRTIVDGHNRYEICNRNDIPFQTVEQEFEDRSAVKIWIIRNQLGRRNLTDFVRIELVEKMKPLVAEKAKENQRLSEGAGNKGLQNSVNLSPVDTQKEIAKSAGVSHDTIWRAEKVINNGSETLKEAARTGEISIRAAAAISELPPEEQNEILATGDKKEVQRKANEIMEAKHKTQAPTNGHKKPVLGPPCIGMQFARIAIMKLSEIQPNDTERTQAFEHVKGWIREHEYQ